MYIYICFNEGMLNAPTQIQVEKGMENERVHFEEPQNCPSSIQTEAQRGSVSANNYPDIKQLGFRNVVIER